jgi:hypothetical protein
MLPKLCFFRIDLFDLCIRHAVTGPCHEEKKWERESEREEEQSIVETSEDLIEKKPLSSSHLDPFVFDGIVNFIPDGGMREKRRRRAVRTSRGWSRVG